MSNAQLWFGFLDAGTKSSLVAIDREMSTGNDGTIYVFNLARSRILEYSRSIVEGKLRELTAKESTSIDQLREAFEAARSDFEPRGGRLTGLAERVVATAPAPRAPAPPDEDEEADDEEMEVLIEADAGDAESDVEQDDWEEEEEA